MSEIRATNLLALTFWLNSNYNPAYKHIFNSYGLFALGTGNKKHWKSLMFSSNDMDISEI